MTKEDLKKFIGVYEIDSDTNMVLTVANGHLIADLGTEPPKELFAESATHFFARDVDAQIEFEQDAGGAISGILLRVDGIESHAKRLADRAEVRLPAEVLLRHAGTYEFAPNVAVVMTVEDGHLMAKPPSDPKQELFAESDTKFFFKTFNAQVEFTQNKAGQTTGLIFHNAGQELRAAKR